MKYPVSSSALFPVAGLLSFPLPAQTQTRPMIMDGQMSGTMEAVFMKHPISTNLLQTE